MTSTELQESDTKTTLHNTVHIGPQVSNFNPFRSTIRHFQDIAYFRIMPYFMCPKSFQQIAKTSQPTFPHDQHTYNNKVRLKSDENWERRVLKIMKLENLQSASNDPKPISRNRASKGPYICALQSPESQTFIRFALRSAVFKIVHILGFGSS